MRRILVTGLVVVLALLALAHVAFYPVGVVVDTPGGGFCGFEVAPHAGAFCNVD